MVAEGDTVVTEHAETWHWHTGEQVTLPFVSVQELRDGSIHPMVGLLGPPDADERRPGLVDRAHHAGLTRRRGGRTPAPLRLGRHSDLGRGSDLGRRSDLGGPQTSGGGGGSARVWPVIWYMVLVIRLAPKIEEPDRQGIAPVPHWSPARRGWRPR